MQNQIPKNWQSVNLGTVATVNMGQSPSSEFYNQNGKELPFYQGVTDFGTKYPSVSMYCSEPVKVAEPGTVLFSVRAPVGEVNIATQQSCIGRGVASISMKNENNDFLYFLLKAKSKELKQVSGGTTYESINKDQIEGIQVVIPVDETEQQKIGKFLSALDDKIGVNNKIAKTLEQMAQAIFKEWFIKSEKLKVKSGKINEIAFVSSGKRPEKLFRTKKEDYEIPVFGAKEVMGFTNNYLFNKKIIITGRVGTIGEVFIVNNYSWPSDNTLVIAPKNKNYFYYLFYVLKRLNFQSLNRGSSQPLITQSDIAEYLIKIPNELIIKKFHMIVSDFFSIIEEKKQENQKLAVLRDLLLPKLMKGEIGV